MSRDFEKEYIELAQNEIPDLWDRIEAGLTEKTVPEPPKTDKPKMIVFRKRYAGFAAALLCAAVVIPAWILTGQMNKSAAFDTAAQEESGGAAEEVCEAAQEDVTEEACEAAQEDVAEEAADTGAGYAETADTALTEESADTVYDAAAVVTDNSTDTAESEDTGRGQEKNAFTKEQEMESASEKKEAASGSASDIADLSRAHVLKNVVVQVISGESVNDEKEESSLEGMLYAVNILEDPSGTFREGEQIEIYIPLYSPLAMYEGGKFEIDILCEDEGKYPFVVSQVYEGNE